MKHLSILVALFLLVSTNTAIAASASIGDRLLAQKADAKENASDELEDLDDIEDEEFITISDPLQSFNVAMYHFNDKLYFWVMKPVARVWGAVIPSPFRTGIKNAFYNIRFPMRFVNSIFQAKGQKAKNEALRFLMNTTVGIGGLFNPAKNIAELNPTEEDFGQSLAVWGNGNGFFLVLPFLGPTTGRDAVGLVGDKALDPLSYFTIFIDALEFPVSLSLSAGEIVNDTSFRIGDYEAIKEAAINPYEAIKDAYIQNRNKKIEE